MSNRLRQTPLLRQSPPLRRVPPYLNVPGAVGVCARIWRAPKPAPTIREALCRQDLDWALAYSIVDLFSARGDTLTYDPQAVLRKVKELQKRGPV